MSGTAEKPTIWDILRQKFIALTPEEWVRQHFVHLLTDHLGYPQSLMANEVKLAVGNKTLRADSVLYHSNLATPKESIFRLFRLCTDSLSELQAIPNSISTLWTLPLTIICSAILWK